MNDYLLRLIALSFALAWLTEAAVEYLIGYLADVFEKLKPIKPFLPYVALAVAEGLVFYYQIDLLTVIPDVNITPIGIALTGFIVSRGAGFVNDFLTFIKGYLVGK